MTTIASTSAVRPTDRGARRAGAWCLAGGLVGVAQCIVMLAWPHQVSDSLYRYPMTTGWYVAAQLSFALQHLTMLAGVLALLRVAVIRSSRTARVATSTAAVGVALLTAVEVVAISAYDVGEHSSRGNLVSFLYGVPVILTGAGLLVAGVVAVRRRNGWTGATWLRGVVLALGIYVFVVLTPAISASFVAGRLGIGGWMILFSALGYGLIRLDPAATR